MSKPKPLPERAAQARKIAAEHRTLAANLARIADRWDADAALLEQGIDPFAVTDSPT